MCQNGALQPDPCTGRAATACPCISWPFGMDALRSGAQASHLQSPRSCTRWIRQRTRSACKVACHDERSRAENPVPGQSFAVASPMCTVTYCMYPMRRVARYEIPVDTDESARTVGSAHIPETYTALNFDCLRPLERIDPPRTRRSARANSYSDQLDCSPNRMLYTHGMHQRLQAV